MPNTGDSDHIDSVRTVDFDIDDVLALEAAGVFTPPYLVVSFSAGSFPAWRLAAREPDKVAGIVFVDPRLPGYEAKYAALLEPGERDQRMKVERGDNDEHYDYIESEALLGQPSALAPLPIRIVANDRHIRWEECGSGCESLTAVTHGLLDDLIATWPQSHVVRVQGTHMVVAEHTDVVLEQIQDVLGSIR